MNDEKSDPLGNLIAKHPSIVIAGCVYGGLAAAVASGSGWGLAALVLGVAGGLAFHVHASILAMEKAEPKDTA